MRKRTTLWLALMVLFLVSIIYILDHRPALQDTVPASTRVFDVTTEPITLIGIQRNGERIELVRKDEDWFLQAPIRARASRLLLSRLAATAERLRSLDTISAEQRALRQLSLADYGLEPGEGVFYLEAGGRREMLRLGSRTPFGGGVYGYRYTTETVVVLPEEALSLLVPTIDDLRDRALFSGSQRRVTRVDLHRREAGFLQLMRRGGRWFIQQPLEWSADPAMVEQLLDALYVLQVQRFVWDAPADTDDGLQSPAFRSQVEEASLAPDQARTRITVWIEGRDTGEELFLGSVDAAAGGQAYARRGGVPSVFTVPDVLAEIAAQHVNHFRDRRVLPPAWEDVTMLGLRYRDGRLALEKAADEHWELVSPVRSPARTDAVLQVLQELARLRIVSFDPVQATDMTEALIVELGLPDRSPEERQQTALYLQRASGEDTASRWIGRIGSDGDLFRMSGFDREAAIDALLQPARYRRRTIWEVDLRSVTRIQQTSVRGDVILQSRTEEGRRPEWILVDAGARALDHDGLPGFLGTLPQLQAESVVAFEPPSLTPYGLHAPTTTLTLRFADATRLQQTLLLGVGAEDGATYALLQGHGFVFRLKDADAQALKADLLQPVARPAPSPEGPPDEIPVLPLEEEEIPGALSPGDNGVLPRSEPGGSL